MNQNDFIKSLENINIEVNEEILVKFSKYKDLLKEYSKKFNLTSIIDDESIYLKHFLDSLYIFKFEGMKNSKELLDIGTGAGFPGIPIAIVNKNIEVTCIEANGKKCDFLRIIKETLDLKNLIIINQRAEDFVRNNREKYDIVTSRAVSNLLVLSELEIPALKIDGYFLPLKSNIEDELNESYNKIEELGGKVERIIEYTLPIENSKRTIPVIKKIKITDDRYPRDYSKIIKDLKNLKK